LSVEDAYGCRLDTNVIIPNGTGIQLVLTATEENISLGESTTLEAVLVTENDISFFEWKPVSLIDEPDELVNEVFPQESTTFTIYAEDIYGCNAIDRLTIYVKASPEVYVPNIFTPNGDDHNDRFFVKGGGSVERIISMEIYDRWGNKIYGVNDIPVHHYESGWDGTFAGKPVDPGVYIYHITFLGKNKKILHSAGDITLIR